MGPCRPARKLTNTPWVTFLPGLRTYSQNKKRFCVCLVARQASGRWSHSRANGRAAAQKLPAAPVPPGQDARSPDAGARATSSHTVPYQRPGNKAFGADGLPPSRAEISSTLARGTRVLGSGALSSQLPMGPAGLWGPGPLPPCVTCPVTPAPARCTGLGRPAPGVTWEEGFQDLGESVASIKSTLKS